MTEFSQQRAYSEEISRLRYLGELEIAIKKCKEAIQLFPSSNFFYKILGDLYAQTGEYYDASQAYIDQLKLLGDRPEQFKNFARFYQLLEKNTSDVFVSKIRKLILDEVQRGEIPTQIKEKLSTFLGPEFLIDEKTYILLKKTNDDQYLNEIIKTIDSINDKDIIRSIIYWSINIEDRSKCHNIDSYFVTVAEKFEMYTEAINLIDKVLMQRIKPNPTMIRALFRICRKIGDYTYAEKALKINSTFIENSDFNIQYELVYFFEYKGDEVLLERTLNKMRTNSANSSIPISRTLYNFYLRFNRFEDAKEISEHIRSLEAAKKSNSQVSRIDVQFESEQGVWDKIQELVSDQEHNRQMIAMRELLKGFSHELGQPITNIRYSTQLYQMKAQKGALTENSIDELIKIIMSQTDRIGNLLARFRPIVSSKSKNEMFNVFDRINAVFLDLSDRLKELNVVYSLRGDKEIQLWGDSIQFDQVFYNLILNSLQAISEFQKGGRINVLLFKNKNGNINIQFSDNGPGISKVSSKKIFEPFYSTKDPSSKNGGGEGLGLFIVWNVLKMFNGNIKLDIKYKTGAKFIISIKSKEVTKNE